MLKDTDSSFVEIMWKILLCEWVRQLSPLLKLTGLKPAKLLLSFCIFYIYIQDSSFQLPTICETFLFGIQQGISKNQV